MRRTSFCSLRPHHVATTCYQKPSVLIQRKKFTTNASNQPSQSTQAQKVTASESAKSTPQTTKVSIQTAKKLKKVLISGAGLAGLTCGM